MYYKSFAEIVERVSRNPVKRRVAVAGAADAHVIEAVIEAQGKGLILPILIGDVDEIRKLLAGPADPRKGSDARAAVASAGDYEIARADTPQACGEVAVECIKTGRADFIMKGLVDTKDVLRPLVNRENGLNQGRTMTHFAINEIPGVERLTVNTDGGMIPCPTLNDKRDIIINAVETLRSMGYERPSVGVLCAVEKVSPSMVETTDAEALVSMNRQGLIENCDVVGPISYDLAMRAEIAKIKGYDCPHCGHFDVLVAPNMVAGNLLNKALTVNAGAKMAGIVVGAKVPVVLTSRGSSAEEKFFSLALSALITDRENRLR
jgi:phosphate butyryltransferase